MNGIDGEDSNKPVSKGPKLSFIESILGKRKSKNANPTSKIEDSKKGFADIDDDENIVTKVETKDVITFDEDRKGMQKFGTEYAHDRLPKSMLEKYGGSGGIKLTKKEQRRLDQQSKL